MAKEKAKVNISLDDSLFSIENDEVKSNFIIHKKSDGLSKGAIAGIVTGVAFAITAIIIYIYIFLDKKRSKRANDDQRCDSSKK